MHASVPADSRRHVRRRVTCAIHTTSHDSSSRHHTIHTRTTEHPPAAPHAVYIYRNKSHSIWGPDWRDVIFLPYGSRLVVMGYSYEIMKYHNCIYFLVYIIHDIPNVRTHTHTHTLASTRIDPPHGARRASYTTIHTVQHPTRNPSINRAHEPFEIAP